MLYLSNRLNVSPLHHHRITTKKYRRIISTKLLLVVILDWEQLGSDREEESQGIYDNVLISCVGWLVQGCSFGDAAADDDVKGGGGERLYQLLLYG